MKIAVIGSTGGNGRLVLAEAVKRGHEVTAFARQATALLGVSGLSSVVEGDGRDRSAVDKAVCGQDAVIVSVQGGGESGVAAGIARTVTTTMSSRNTSRLVATSAYGMVATRPYVAAALVRRIFAKAFADQLAADNIIHASALDWTLLRATRLTDNPAKGAPRMSTELFTKGPYSLARSLYATALLDLAEGNAYAAQTVNITG
ncbi:MAG: NAD(P)-dependent oxidoreductase [Acidimicrobiales bacterium]